MSQMHPTECGATRQTTRSRSLHTTKKLPLLRRDDSIVPCKRPHVIHHHPSRRVATVAEGDTTALATFRGGAKVAATRRVSPARLCTTKHRACSLHAVAPQASTPALLRPHSGASGASPQPSHRATIENRDASRRAAGHLRWEAASRPSLALQKQPCSCSRPCGPSDVFVRVRTVRCRLPAPAATEIAIRRDERPKLTTHATIGRGAPEPGQFQVPLR